MVKLLILACILTHSLMASILEKGLALNFKEQVVIRTKKIEIPGFPQAFNPSLLKIKEGFLLTFRAVPDLEKAPWISNIGVMILNDAFEPISEPQLLNTRPGDHITPSQSEDARIFTYRGRIFLIYNDNLEEVCIDYHHERSLYIAELFQDRHQFSLSLPLKLFHEQKFQPVQKNWTPFEYGNQLLLSYTINPHEILYPNLSSGACHTLYETKMHLDWKWGPLKGSTPPQLVDGEYWSFFHSGTRLVSSASSGYDMWHYFMGVYTFSAHPPFQMTKISQLPLIAEGFYTSSSYYKRVIFPGGFVVLGPLIYVAYGKDDEEIWIATLNKEALKRTLIEVKEKGAIPSPRK